MVRDLGKTVSQAGDDFRFAASVAAFGMLLRGSPHAGDATWREVLELAQASLGADPGGYRAEFLELVRAAAELSGGR